MDRTGRWLIAVALGLSVAAGAAWAEDEHDHGAHHHDEAAGASTEQTLTGEVVDVFCYLSHSESGLGQGHASCAKKCIQSGLPVALKVGDQLYLAVMANHEPANKTFAELAGQQVTVHGQVLEKDGQHVISVKQVEKVN